MSSNHSNPQYAVGLFCVILFILLYSTSDILYASEPVIIVIDPGHGGENLGTT